MCGTAPLIATVAISILLGIIYSADVPFLRWKKHPVAAAACILIVRAILVQVRSPWPCVVLVPFARLD